MGVAHPGGGPRAGCRRGHVRGWPPDTSDRAEVDELQAERLNALQESAAAREAKEQLEKHVATLEARSFQDQNVLQALAPLNDQLRTVGRHVTQLERDRAEQFGAVSQALDAARSTDAQLLEATGSLSSSLRSTTVRGAWGEMQLRRVVEAAGMLRHVDFTEQDSRTTDRGVQRPDMIVKLPGGQVIVVDAKAPMNSYLDAQAVPADGSPENDQRRAQSLKAHSKALRAHVDALATKQYWTGNDGSPELVMCFVPVESAWPQPWKRMRCCWNTRLGTMWRWCPRYRSWHP
nr:DNA recombination protein RmuC [Kocuria atrinae]